MYGELSPQDSPAGDRPRGELRALLDDFAAALSQFDLSAGFNLYLPGIQWPVVRLSDDTAK
jgi:hypothetical protein